MIDSVEQLVTHPWWAFLWPPVLGFGIFLFGMALRPILFSRLKRWAEKTRWAWDDLAIEVIRGPFLLWCLIAGVYVTVVTLPGDPQAQDSAAKLLTILWLISLTVAILRLADQIIQRYGEKLAGALPLTTLTQNLTKGIILVLGGLMVMNSLGISITPLLTALGVGGLAVALALQETLSNLFAGIYVTMARQVRLGDYIKLDSGEEGFVTDIGWRSTRIQTLPNNLVIIPNTKLAQAIVTNFNLPTRDMAVLVEVGADYRSDLEKVERVTLEVGREVMKSVPGGVPSFEPMVRFHTFADSSVNFTVVLRGQLFVDQYLIKHGFIKRLHRRYVEEGISIPFPTRIVITESR